MIWFKNYRRQNVDVIATFLFQRFFIYLFFWNVLSICFQWIFKLYFFFWITFIFWLLGIVFNDITYFLQLYHHSILCDHNRSQSIIIGAKNAFLIYFLETLRNFWNDILNVSVLRWAQWLKNSNWVKENFGFYPKML